MKGNSHSLCKTKPQRARNTAHLLTIVILFLIFTGCATLGTRPKPENNIENALMNAVENAFKSVSTDSKIAVIHIQTSSSDVSEFLLGELQHILVNRDYNVVDRADLDRIRAERDFQYSYEVDDDTAVSVGKFVGADIVVTGGISGTDSLRRLRLKVLDTQTAIIKGTASVPYSEEDLRQASKPKPIKAPPKVTTTNVEISFKLFAGGDQNWFSGYGDVDGEFKGIFGYNMGGSLEVRHRKYPVILETGARYITKGAEYEEKFFGKPATLTETFTFVDTFAKAKWELPIITNMTIQPFVGYAAGKLFSANESFKYENHKTDYNTTKYCHSLLHVLLVGADLVISDAWLIGVEYDYCLTDVYKDDNYKYALNSILFNVGYKF